MAGIPLYITLFFALVGVSCAESSRGGSLRLTDPCRNNTIVVFVAHEGNDLLFMNPALMDAYDGGRCLVVVYTTAGDGGHKGDYYIESREDGVKEAYALMASTPNEWDQRNFYVKMFKLRSFELAHSSGIRLVFMRLPDGFSKGHGTGAYRNESLLRLYRGELPFIFTTDGNYRYSEENIVDVFTDLIVRFKPNAVFTLDFDCTYPGGGYTDREDHSDHIVTARYARRAFLKAEVVAPDEGRGLRSFRGYTAEYLEANVEPSEVLNSKREIFRAYLRHENCRPLECPPPAEVLPEAYEVWSARQYELPTPTPMPGVIMSWMGSNLPPNGPWDNALCLSDIPEYGKIVTGRCRGSERQHWQLYDDRDMIVHIHSGLCLSVVNDRDEPHLVECEWKDPVGQTWSRLPYGLLKNGLNGRCLHHDDRLLHNASIVMAHCDEQRPEQRWRIGEMGGRSTAE